MKKRAVLGSAWQRLTKITAATGVAALSMTAPAAAGPSTFKIYVDEPAVYRVDYEDLVDAGLASATGLTSETLGITHFGEGVPIWVQDAGDGVFGPGDRIEFVGEHLPGEVSYLNEHTRYNVYVLRTDLAQPPRMSVRGPRPAARPSGRAVLLRERHLEEDLLLIRLHARRDGKAQELWFWEKLVRGHDPIVHRLDLQDLETAPDALPPASRKVNLRVHLRGWSNPRKKGDPKIPDHQVDVALNGVFLRSFRWDGQEPHLLELSDLPLESFAAGDNALSFSVPKRAQADGNPLIDVVLLNWIEIVYPRTPRVGEEQVRLRAAEEAGTVRLVVESKEDELLVFGDQGWRISSLHGDEPRREIDFDLLAGGGFTATPARRLAAPARVVADRPSRLRDPENRADYVMITHHRFREALEPLAELHRRRGLRVMVVDVEDVYDEFHHGVMHPRAIREMLRHAHRNWTHPAPRFVLLVGDASWDNKNARAVDENYADWTVRQGELARFGKNASTPYKDSRHRHFVPTWNYATYQGHAASDHAFALLDDDTLPDLAIGRLPVADPEEVTAIVEKTARYILRPEPGAWQRRALFITNEDETFKARSDRVAETLSAAGYAPQKIYPESAEKTNEHHTQRMIDALDEGLLFVHFYGHGGRYIWRTGPPSLVKNHDLFTLDHLDRLTPNDKLPVVLSMTCYSAPFDHPSADSIGEKLLRIPDRGSVGVIAASWRNRPSYRWGEAILEELVKPGATVGEALMRSKHEVRHPVFLYTYNLLGDPAVPVPLPELSALASTSTPDRSSASTEDRGSEPAELNRPEER